MCVEKRNRPAIWRTILTGGRAPNGERLYRFVHQARGACGEYVSYCVAWSEAVEDAPVFVPAGDGAFKLPLSDGSYPMRQVVARGLKLTVRDAVINGDSDELVFLFDLRNESDSDAVELQRAVAVVAEVPCELASADNGPRIRARADVSRLVERPAAGHVAARLVPGAAAHFLCCAFSLRAVYEALEGKRFESVRVGLRLGAGQDVVVDVAVRVLGEPADGFLVAAGGVVEMKVGWRAAMDRRLVAGFMGARRS